MEPTQAARETTAGVVELPAKFMTDGETYKRGGELGFSGVDFYVGGRAGVLGDVDADVVAAAFLYFNPDAVRTMWDAAGGVCPRATAAREFAACAHRWGTNHLGDGPDYARLAKLSGDIVAAASPANAPLFAGWRTLEAPSEPKAATVHNLNALRELRGGLHGGAVLAAGLSPVQAMALHSPQMAGLFGWADLPATDGLDASWNEAEAATNRALGRLYAVLDGAELDEYVALVAEAVSATT